MKMFLKRTKGSITVMVTLILVPTIFFSGFMVDLARIKLYSNQALMTADNYGQAILTDYDNLLKELYGLFAVTQNEEGKQALDDLEAYIKSSFSPNKNTISWKYLQAALGQTEYSGFMPYQNANVELSYTNVQGANLGNPAVFSTQVGDFMKFRIAQTLFDNGTEDNDGNDNTDQLLDTVFKVQDMGKMAEVISKKEKVCEKVAELLDNEVRDYYDELKDLAEYPDYLEQMNDAYEEGRGEIESAVGSLAYEAYWYLNVYEEEIEAALEHQREIEEAMEQARNAGEDEEPIKIEELTDEEKELIENYEKYKDVPNANAAYFEEIFDKAIEKVKESVEWEPVDFENFEEKSNKLKSYADEIETKINEIKVLYDQLQETLESTDVDESLKEEIKKDMSVIEKLFKVDGEFSADNYVKLAEHLVNQQPENLGYKSDMETIISTMEELTDEYLEPVESPETEWEEPLDVESWEDFTETSNYEKLYNSLKQCFETTENEDTEKAKQKEKDAEEAQKQAEEKLKNEPTDARNIPEGLMLRGTGAGGEENYDLMENIDDAATYFNINKVLEEANELLLKLYTVQYDMGMFSSRVTNVKVDEGAEMKESLTGYAMSGDINYLYKAELEYILGGNNSSQSNLDGARNMILGFRAVINYTATYTVEPVNTAIKAISDPLNVVNPLLAVAVSSALRLAVASMETASDWALLMEGEAVVLWKEEISDMTTGSALANLLGIDVSENKSQKFAMDYEQYLMVMLIFLTTSEQIAERTSDLITLNVNTVSQNIGSSGTLSKLTFMMDKAVTAVNATCKIQLDFVVMPQGFARSMTDDETYSELENFEKNSYQFTVTRGY